MNIIISGCNGKMGQVLTEEIEKEEGMKVVAGLDNNIFKEENSYPVFESLLDFEGEADVIIDFSHPSCLDDILAYSIEKKIPLLIATTGFSSQQIEQIREGGQQIPILLSANMSLGVNLLKNIVSKAASILHNSFDTEIIEKHHNKKLDSPSGTAYMLADAINESLDGSMEYIYGREGQAKREKKEIGIHAIRGGAISGEHTVIFAGPEETLELKHTALSKRVFATGALDAARFLIKQNNGFYTMDDMFDMD